MRISKKTLSCFWVVLFFDVFCLRIDSISYLTSFGSVYKEIPIILLVFVAGILLIKRERISDISKWILIYYAFFFLVTILSGGKWHVTLVNIASSIVMSLITEYYMKRNWITFIKCTAIILTTILLFDLLTILACPNGLYATNLYTDNWILGYKTAHANVALPAIAMIAITSVIKKSRITLFSWILMLLALLDTVLCGATAGSVSIIIFLILLFACFQVPTKRIKKVLIELLNIKVMFPTIILLNILIVFIQNVEVFEPIIVGILGKTMSLTGRTTIWQACLMLFKENPFWGTGYLDATEFVAITNIGGGTQPHNLFMSILVYTGIIGLILFSVTFIKAFKKIYTDKPNVTNILGFWLIANFILGITSMNTFATYNMAAMVMLGYIGQYYKQIPKVS